MPLQFIDDKLRGRCDSIIGVESATQHLKSLVSDRRSRCRRRFLTQESREPSASVAGSRRPLLATGGFSGDTCDAISVQGPCAGGEGCALQHHSVAGVPIFMNGGDATDSGVAGDHRKIGGQADQVLEVYDIRSAVFNFPAKGLGDSCGEKMIPKITSSGIVHDAGHGKTVHDFCEDIPIMGLGVTVPGENSDAMAVPLQNTR